MAPRLAWILSLDMMAFFMVSRDFWASFWVEMEEPPPEELALRFVSLIQPNEPLLYPLITCSWSVRRIYTMKNKEIPRSKQKNMLLVVLALLAISYLVYASNVFFMSETERLMTSKIMGTKRSCFLVRFRCRTGTT